MDSISIIIVIIVVIIIFVCLHLGILMVVATYCWD